eukprot:IDg13553t1
MPSFFTSRVGRSLEGYMGNRFGRRSELMARRPGESSCESLTTKARRPGEDSATKVGARPEGNVLLRTHKGSRKAERVFRNGTPGGLALWCR